jgi:hypothetical protein
MFIAGFLLLFNMYHNPIDLNGFWDSPNGARNYVTQVKNEVWCTGEDSATNPGKRPFVYGKIKGKKISFAAESLSDNNQINAGKLELEIISKDKLLVKSINGDGESINGEWHREIIVTSRK